MHVIAAMSGGVDSSVAAALLVEAGHRVTGVFLRNGIAAGSRAAAGKQGCCSVGDAADAARVADLLGIDFYSLDFSADFGRIVEDFARSYAAGRTPNPCVQCNRDLKFGRLLRYADALGADAVATGHYADRVVRDGRQALRIPADRAKDQTYVLFPLGQEELARSLFPLAGMTKGETRAFAAARGLPVAEKPESMEICFVPGGDYRDVVAAREPEAFAAGDVVDEATGHVVGRHAGVATVTVGQRRGFGAVGPEPRYVTRIDVARNAVVVGAAADLLRREVLVEGWNAVAAPAPAPGSRTACYAKVRRNHVAQRAEIVGLPDSSDASSSTASVTSAAEPGSRAATSHLAESLSLEAAGSRVRVVFDPPVRAPAPGQALVAYDADGFVLGGGWIAAA